MTNAGAPGKGSHSGGLCRKDAVAGALECSLREAGYWLCRQGWGRGGEAMGSSQ